MGLGAVRGSVRQVTQYPLRKANHHSRAFIHSADVTRGTAILPATALLLLLLLPWMLLMMMTMMMMK